MDAAVFAREKSPDIRPFVVSGVVPDHVDDAFILIAGLNFGQQLHGTHAIHCDRRDERRIEGFKVQRAVNFDAGAACRGFERGVCTLLCPTEGRFALILWMHGVCEVYRLIIGHRIQHVFIHCDEFSLFSYISHARLRLGLSVFIAQSGQKFDAARVGIVQTALSCDMGPDLYRRATEAGFQPSA